MFDWEHISHIQSSIQYENNSLAAREVNGSRIQLGSGEGTGTAC